ncbi:MAG TPA: FAD-dependent oxidoreductase, partial [Mycobacterium sp.]
DVEFGGTWVLPEHQHILAEMSRYGLRLEETPKPDRYIVRTAEAVLGSPAVPSESIEELTAALSASEGWDDSVSLDEWLARRGVGSAARAWMDIFCRYLNGCRMDEAAATTFRGATGALLADLDHYNLTIQGGTGQLVSSLHSDGPGAQTGRAVRAIVPSRRGFTVNADGGPSVDAAAVVMATPVNTWPHISLPAGVTAATRPLGTHPGASVKLWLEVEGVDGTVRASDATGPFAYVRTYRKLGGDRSLLVAFGTASDLGRADLTPRAIERELRQLLPEVRVRAVDTHDWNNDPLFRGAWLAKPPGFDRRATAVREIDGRFIFAGADISRHHAATLDGAIASGQEAASEVLNYLA